jgi:hypothetical protein
MGARSLSSPPKVWRGVRTFGRRSSIRLPRSARQQRGEPPYPIVDLVARSKRPATSWASCGDFAGKKPEDTRDRANCKGAQNIPQNRGRVSVVPTARGVGEVAIHRSVRAGGPTQRINRRSGRESGHAPGPFGDDPHASPRNAAPVELPLASAASHANDERTQWENQRSVSAPALIEVR